jgi:hypothetical protein
LGKAIITFTEAMEIPDGYKDFDNEVMLVKIIPDKDSDKN